MEKIDTDPFIRFRRKESKKMTKKIYGMKLNGTIVLEMNLKNGFSMNKVTIPLFHKMIFVNTLILKNLQNLQE